jgi:hypothetical protein
MAGRAVVPYLGAPVMSIPRSARPAFTGNHSGIAILLSVFLTSVTIP